MRIVLLPWHTSPPKDKITPPFPVKFISTKNTLNKLWSQSSNHNPFLAFDVPGIYLPKDDSVLSVHKTRIYKHWAKKLQELRELYHIISETLMHYLPVEYTPCCSLLLFRLMSEVGRKPEGGQQSEAQFLSGQPPVCCSKDSCQLHLGNDPT